VNAPLVIAGVTVAGGLIGLGSGWLAVALEKVEKLEEEERQERLEYERDIAEALPISTNKNASVMPIQRPVSETA